MRLAWVLQFLFSLGMQDGAHAIIGGKPLDLSQAVAHTTVSISETDARSFCSGSIVSQNAVLTAAHCVYGKNPQSLSITFGPDGLHSTLSRPVVKTYVPQQYATYGDRLPNVKNAWDIALVVFSGTLPAPYRIAQLVNGDALVVGETIEIAGYGFNQPDGSGGGILRGCSTPVLDPHYSPSEIMLNANSGCSPAGRDSGGPVYRVYGSTVYVYALHIWGWHNDAQQPIYGIHTRVGAYYNWIQSILLNPIGI